MLSAATRLVWFSLLGACLAAPEARAAGPGVTGMWLDQSGRAGIDIEPCGSSICGTIVWLKEPLTAAGKPKLDIHNPQDSLQGRKICGMTMLYNFVPDGDGGWKNGYIYDPATGKTYNASVQMTPDGTLAVRGYMQFTFLGRTQVWKRPAEALPRCS